MTLLPLACPPFPALATGNATAQVARALAEGATERAAIVRRFDEGDPDGLNDAADD